MAQMYISYIGRAIIILAARCEKPVLIASSRVRFTFKTKCLNLFLHVRSYERECSCIIEFTIQMLG